VLDFFGTAACRPIVPLPPRSSPHSSPDTPRIIYARETSASEGGDYTKNFASTFVINGGTRFFYMPQSWDMGQILSPPLRRKIPEKIQRLRSGLNPRTRVSGASMLTTRPPKPSCKYLVQNNHTMCKVAVPFKLLASELFFLISAHYVYKM